MGMDCGAHGRRCENSEDRMIKVHHLNGGKRYDSDFEKEAMLGKFSLASGCDELKKQCSLEREVQ